MALPHGVTDENIAEDSVGLGLGGVRRMEAMPNYRRDPQHVQQTRGDELNPEPLGFIPESEVPGFFVVDRQFDFRK